MKIMGLAEIMDSSMDFLRKHFKSIALYVLGYTAICIMIIIGLVIFIAITGGILGAVGGFLESLPGEIVIVAVIIVMYISMIFMITSGVNIGIIKITSCQYTDKSFGAAEAIKITFRKLWKAAALIIVGNLPLLLFLFAFFYFLWPFFSEYFILMTRDFGVYQIIISILIGLFVGFIVLTYTVLLVFVFQALVIENRGIFSSLKRSYQLVKDDFFKIVKYVILFGLVVYAVNASLQGILGLLSLVIYLAAQFLNIYVDYYDLVIQVTSVGRIPFFLLNWLIISPLTTIMITQFYYQRRFKKEGYDLLLRIKALNKSLKGNN